MKRIGRIHQLLGMAALMGGMGGSSSGASYEPKHHLGFRESAFPRSTGSSGKPAKKVNRLHLKKKAKLIKRLAAK